MIAVTFAWALFVALTVPGVVTAVRALPWVAAQVDRGVKPWACDICMSFWTSALVTLVAGALEGARGVLRGDRPAELALSVSWALLAAGPGYTGALTALRWLNRAPSGPVELPEE